MDKLSPNTQRLIWILLATALILLSALPRFKEVAEYLKNFASVIFGGVLVTKPGDAPAPLVDIIQKIHNSLAPPSNTER